MATSQPHASIVVIGSLNMDLVTYTPRIPQGGETMTASSFHTGLGGKGANQAVACAKLSRRRKINDTDGSEVADATNDPEATASVYMVGAVGDDAYGAVMKAGLRAFGVDASGVEERHGCKTGVAVILVEEPRGENRILLSPEANAELGPEYFVETLMPATITMPSLLPSLLIMQLEIPRPTVLQAMATAHRLGVPVLLNPAPAQPIPTEYYRYITHFVVNETEAVQMSAPNFTAADVDLQQAGQPQRIEAVAAYFAGLGAAHVIITLGGHGVYYYEAATTHSGVRGLVPAEKVSVVDTTAAGDTFVGAYALEYVKAMSARGGSGSGGAAVFDMEKAIRLANRAAAKTVQRKGAQDSIPWLDEL